MFYCILGKGPPRFTLAAAFGALALLASPRAAAQTGPLSTNPAWESGSASLTRAVAVGDLDRDGILDLVCGTLGGPNTLFRGVGRFFTTNSIWSPVTVATMSLALGDIDGDGDLDLVCGNVGTNTVYTNVGGILSTTPSSSLPGASTTTGVALADIDGDGDLDLACANGADGVSVFRNTGGVFETPAVWSSARNHTTSIALGDVDGDGVLDLACGNLGQENTLYRGALGVFEAQPAWTSDSLLSTVGVRLGDIDGDGLLDLVCAALEHGTMYRNLGTTLDTIPAWVSSPGTALCLDLGDADSDGDLDLVFGIEGGANVLYRNDGGVLTATPVWTSARQNDTAGIALADADGDGDLDLVCGNSNQTNAVYENVTPPLPGTPDWSSGNVGQTLAVDVGDVTGDGRPDLVCGNLGPNSLYANDGTPLESLPSWQSAAIVLTAGVVLGDLDGDGDLDLVCGNAGANTSYSNAGGVLALSPSWTSSELNTTTGVALGDMDNDGDLDLVCANASGENTMYRNSGAGLATTPSWGAPTDGAADLALGDVDGDGDLDVVFANTDDTANTLYRNDGGMLSLAPVWSSGPANASSSVALGDIDGDGFVDAVFGNVLQASTVYLHSGASFDTSPAWSSAPTQATGCVALGDVDGDGDLDLVCGNLSQPDALYLNNGGVLSTSPGWTSVAAVETEDIALADIDGDGDLDLVCGNELSPSTVYLGLRNPPYRHDPAAPMHQTPNVPAFVSAVSVTEPTVNHRTVSVSIVDADNDPVWVRVEYQFEGEPVWYAADVGASGLAGPFASSATGAVDSLDWDVTRIAFDTREVSLRVKALEVPARVSTIQRIPSYTAALGRITPARAEIRPAVAAVAFATVTQGDTVSVAIPVENRGNVDLVIDDVGLPSAEMRTDAISFPLVIAPGATDTLRVFLEPLVETSVTGSIAISSNDALTPVYDVGVTTDIRALAATTRLLAAASTIPLGEAATVIVAPLPQVHVEGGTLYHRAAGRGPFDAIPLGKSGSDFVAVIPGAAVTEGGIEYYVEVYNAPVVAADPPGAPGEGVFFQSVASPASLSSAPRPTLGEEFGAGLDIRVDVRLPVGAAFVSGTLYYREGGAGTYGAAPLTVVGDAPAAIIDGTIAGPRGVEYYADVQTLTASITDPGVNPAASPNTIRVLVSDLVEPTAHAGESYRLFSVPLDMQGSILGSLADELGGKENTQWRLFGYDAVAARYRELPSADESRFTQGKAYWLITRDTHRIGTGADNGLSTPTGAPFAITLQPGYNLVSSPFDFDVAWSSCFVETLAVTDTLAGAIVEPPVAWLPRVGYAYDVRTFHPFDGYWVKNRTDAPVVLKIPPRAAAAPVAVAGNPRGTNGWRLALRATVDGATSTAATLGVEPAANDDGDGLDRALPPLPPGRSVAVYFPNGNGEEPVALARDLRSTGETGHVWRFDVVKTFAVEGGGDDVTVAVEGIDALPPELSVALVDRVLGRVVDARVRAGVEVVIGERGMTSTAENARFALVVGTREFVDAQAGAMTLPPLRTVLLQNHPNPFNPRTVIRYDLDRAAHVSLRVYDVRGNLVRVLDERELPAGRYEIGWNGTDDRGTLVASGVYFYRLTAGPFQATRKMVLLK